MTTGRIFNLNGKTYRYDTELNFEDRTSTKTLSVLKKDENGKDVFSPIIKKSKYGDGAYIYENLNTKEVILADNFRSKNTYDVMQRFGDDIWSNQHIGSIHENKITTGSTSKQIVRALQRVIAMIRSF